MYAKQSLAEKPGAISFEDHVHRELRAEEVLSIQKRALKGVIFIALIQDITVPVVNLIVLGTGPAGGEEFLVSQGLVDDE